LRRIKLDAGLDLVPGVVGWLGPPAAHMADRPGGNLFAHRASEHNKNRIKSLIKPLFTVISLSLTCSDQVIFCPFIVCSWKTQSLDSEHP
jgi:hypothetical protein